VHRDLPFPRPARRPPAPVSILLAALLLLGSAVPSHADDTFHEQSLDLPGAPAALIPADLDGDGRRDLVVVVVYTEWDQIGIEEYAEMDQVAGLVEVLTIVPILMDRREVRAYLGQEDGSFALAGEPLPLPLSVLSMEAGPPGMSRLPVVALTDDGVATLALAPDGTLSFEPVIAEPPVLAGTGTFLAHLDLVADATGDGVADLLLPTPDGIALYRGVPGHGRGVETVPFARVPYPQEDATPRGLVLDVPLPTVVDADGDGLPDLLFRSPDRGLAGASVALQTAPGRFAPPGEIPWPHPAHSADSGDDNTEEVWIGPVDREAGAELVAADSLDDEDAGMRKSMEQAREPRFRVRVHPLRTPGAAEPVTTSGEDKLPPLIPDAEPARTFDVRGWVAQGSGDLVLPGGFQDLNGDGRSDLVTVTNDITLFKAVSILATRRLTLELGFLAWCQQPDGGFVRAPGEPLTSKLTINLNDLEIRQRSLFAGDFDGDGRRDFLQLGGSKEIGIHLGRPNCSYPDRPDVTIRLRNPLRDLALAETLDLDGDGRSDLALIHPRPVDEAGLSPPVRLDLYRSALPEGGRR